MTIKKKHILIIEDEVNLLNALSKKLEANSYEIHTAKNGAKGLEQALKHKPDLILLDILMPKMNGLEMIKKLREDDWGKNAPVIIISNLSPDNTEIIQNVIEFKPIHYIVKSDWSLNEIIDKINELLG